MKAFLTKVHNVCAPLNVWNLMLLNGLLIQCFKTEYFHFVYMGFVSSLDISVIMERDNHNTSHSQLQTSYHSLTEERDQLQTSYHNLTEERDQLQTEVNELKRHIEVQSVILYELKWKWCPEGWNRSGCSCYYTSTESDTWWQSREKCRSKGADLVVINSKEEQDFVRGLKMKRASWIGLWTVWKQQSQTMEWEWVDKSPITVT
uniref:C-type lectin domain-containing protein n=1 Tax=Myripristis murdjan TaxID=586833 RepID=A0A667WYC5_9TELE